MYHQIYVILLNNSNRFKEVQLSLYESSYAALYRSKKNVSSDIRYTWECITMGEFKQCKVILAVSSHATSEVK